MIGRNAVLFAHAPDTLAIIAAVGSATALMAGTIGLVQNDIKRVLAYSTVSQLGYMFLAMGMGAYAAGIFHLYTHAFFKALLFLGSGAVIHALHGEQDIRNMGGLRTYLPVTFWTFMIGSLAIAGVPFLSGFFSKDEILFETFYRGHQWLWVIGVVTSLLTATYMFRLVYLTFFGRERFAMAHSSHPSHPSTAPHPSHPGTAPHLTHPSHPSHPSHLHDAPPAMAVALVVLAIGSVFAGYIGFPHALGGHNLLGAWLEPAFEAHPAPASNLSAMTVGGCVPGTADTTTAGGALAGMAIADCAPGTTTGGSDVALASSFLIADATQPAAEHQPAAAAGAPADHAESAASEQQKIALERYLMALSSLVALLGIALASWLWLKNPAVADRIANRFPALHRVLLNKYYVDEFYDATVVQPVRIVSEDGLWRGMDVRVVDGAVNGAGQVVGGMSALLRLLQTGSVKTYAAATLMGVVAILGYYFWR
jgi:NADH-quinone oxidoreductase subunit L